MKFVRVDEHVHDKLRELSETRKANNTIINKYKDILAELVVAAHKREVKQ